MTEIRLDAVSALRGLTDHPHYRYRGCAPDVDDPRMAAGGSGVSVDSWQAPDLDGGESREVREAREAAAVDVCVGCPVMVQCMAFGASVTADGKLAEPFSVLGGMTPLERHKAFVEYKKAQAEAVPVESEPIQVEELRTPQKLAVLRGLARFSDPVDVADAAGLDLRTTKWQLSRMAGQMRLEKSAGRSEMLAVAVELGLIAASEVREPRPLPVGQLTLFDADVQLDLSGAAPLPPSSSAAAAVSFISSRKRLEAAA